MQAVEVALKSNVIMTALSEQLPLMQNYSMTALVAKRTIY
jgi:hypothetical protein